MAVGWPMRRKLIVLSTVLFLWGFAAGYALPLVSPEAARALYSLIREAVIGKIGGSITPGPWLSLAIFVNNVRVALVTLALGLTVIVPAIVVAGNGALLGLVSSMAISTGRPLLVVLASILPHGVFEIPALIYTASVSLELGALLWMRVLGKAGGLEAALRRLPRDVAIIVALFLLAALLEGLVTPAVVALVQSL
ncbi:stage II sporulation protein M [Infirmifilum lucidum]|uniref:Stage II sporulation protein M n=1 Tax=Infirmifilum lucidum TaxID=2776706 RepID=A0A7L9FGF3_9CREN|nr:stage II sporulation protein M [Infirmifilum lucidum]QOJ78898.1 stage II sporulation protein M [Infirmifilum lucidum]